MTTTGDPLGLMQRDGIGVHQRRKVFELRNQYDLTDDSYLTLALDAYEENHGEPGGLNQALYAADRDQATRLHDRFELRRYIPSLTFQKELSEQTALSVKGWGGYYDRFSHRQTGGGFGNVPTGTSNNVERQEF